jgi:hypothetical protein
MSRVGQNHIYTVYIRYYCMEVTKYTFIYDVYDVYIRFWPTLDKSDITLLHSKKWSSIVTHRTQQLLEY